MGDVKIMRDTKEGWRLSNFNMWNMIFLIINALHDTSLQLDKLTMHELLHLLYLNLITHHMFRYQL